MKRLFALALALGMILALSACQPAGEDPTTAPPTSGNAPTTQAPPEEPTKDTIYVALGADVAILDPYFTSSATDNLINAEIYEGLIQNMPDNTIEPQLATRWEVSEDGLEYTFWLRDDVYFHNGEHMTSEDVIFSAERAFKSPYMASTFALYCEKAEAIDDYTVKLTLRQPYAPFITLCDASWVIHSKKALEDAGSNEAFFEHPIGCGPYEYVSRQQGTSVTLKRFENYYGEDKARIPNVVFRIITDPTTLTLAVQAGEIDLAGYGSSVSAADLPILEAQDDLTVSYVDGLRTLYITYNTTVAPFDNVLVRKAIAYAVDKEFMIDVTEGGHGIVARAMTNQLVFGFSEALTGYPYNVEKAKELLAEAGYPNGDGFPVFKFKFMEGKAKSDCEIIQANLAEIGITIELETLEKNAYLQQVLNGDYEFAHLGITLGNDSAYYSQIYTTPNIGGLNSARFSDPLVDQLFNEAEITTDLAARMAKYEEVFLYLEDLCVYAPLYFNQYAYVSSTDIQLGTFYPTGLFIHHISAMK